MRWWVSLSLALLSGSWVLGATVPEASAQLQAAYPGVQFYTVGRQLVQLYGADFGYGRTPEEAADAFVQTYGEVFGVGAGELQPGNAFSGRFVQPVMYDAATGTYKFALVYYRQYKDGIPVYGADLRLLVKNEAGCPLVLANANLFDLRSFAVPARAGADVAEGAAHAAAAAFKPGLLEFGASELVIWPDAESKPSVPRVALTFVGQGVNARGQFMKFRFVTDADSGAILHTENLIHFTDVTGNVSGMATTGPKSDDCGPEAVLPMPYARVYITAGANAYADVNGDFAIPNGGSAQVTVQSFMAGLYFVVDNAMGGEETLSVSVLPPGPANFVHNAENTLPAVRAQVNAYVQANIVRDWVLAQNPAYPVIHEQTTFPIYVNRADGFCPGNAWYDGSSLNFCVASSGYPNTAYSSVVHHEYGHHIVQCGDSGQGQYGEGLSDSVAVLIADDPILGYGFFGDCTAGLRTADNTMQYPCSDEAHACAGLLSGCIWDTRNALLLTEPVNYLSILSNLTLNSVLAHTGTLITPAIYNTFITLDGGTDGPHYDEITAGFAAHNMIPQPPPPNDACADAIVACPGQTYTGNTASATVDGATTCGSSSSTADVWYQYTPATSGSATFSLCGAGTTYDSVLSVHSGCPGTAANSLNCDDDGCGGFSAPSTVTRNVTAGTTYLIRVSGWSGSAGAYALTITGPACQSVDYTLTTSVTPAGTGSITLNPPGGTYPSGTTVTVMADAIGGWHFDHWTGDLGGATNPATVLMNRNKSVTAVFVQDLFTLTINVVGLGTVTLNPAGGSYPSGTTVQLTADASEHWRFSHWEDDLSGSANPATIVMDAPHIVTAVFELPGDLDCSGLVNFGDINPFVLALTNPATYTDVYPSCSILNADINGDGVANFEDINPFVERIVNP